MEAKLYKWESQKENLTHRKEHGDVLRRIAEEMSCDEKEIGKIKRGERYKIC